MKSHKIKLILFFCLIIPLKVYLQEIAPDSLILKFYNDQVVDLSGSRGLTSSYVNPEIFQHKIKTIDDFADELKGFYYEKKDICFLLFFYNNNILTRYLLEPGKVIEKVAIKISADEILKINEDVHRVLQLGKLTADRSPVKREVRLGETVKPSNPVDPVKTMQKARKLLLPENFPFRYQHMIIVPTLNIGTFPFSLLKPYGDGSYLIEKCSYAISPGLFDLLAFNVNNAHGRHFSYSELKDKNFLFISNPAYPTHTIYHFPDLPGARKEIEQLIPLMKHAVLLEGEDATKETVLKEIGKADVVYFATHGIANNRAMMDSSFLVLSGENDPFLTARDIMNLRDSTVKYYRESRKPFPFMAVLSACQTGLGRSMEAGVAGIARSFLLAGANHVIMSLWNVDDESTAFYMNRFMVHLENGDVNYQPSAALRQAALETKAKFPNPEQWACFSVFGVTKHNPFDEY